MTCLVPQAIAKTTSADKGNVAPFRVYYHGQFADQNYKAIPITQAFIVQANDYYLQAVGTLFRDKRLAIYRKLESTLFKSGAIPALDQAKVRATTLRAWVNDAKSRKLLASQHVDRLDKHQRALRLAILPAFETVLKSKIDWTKINTLHPTTKSLLRSFYWQNRSSWLAAALAGNLQIIPFDLAFPDSGDYTAQCRAAGVPIPPDWGDSRWKFQGELKDEFVFARNRALVYAYSSSNPEGACIALPRQIDRWFDTPFISGFGIVCQSAQTENACFWDRTVSTSSEDFNSHISLDEFSGADDDIESCTSCHAGENAFIIHPDTPLDLNPAHFNISATWYNPIVPSDWPQNEAAVNLQTNTSYTTTDLFTGTTQHNGSSCTRCHALPAFETEDMKDAYCNAVLRPAVNRTMPPRRFDPDEHPAGWGGFLDFDGDYRVHVNQLKALCN